MRLSHPAQRTLTFRQFALVLAVVAVFDLALPVSASDSQAF